MKLERLLQLQRELEGKFYDPANQSLRGKEVWTKEHIMSIVAESMELLDLINWKHWKTKTKTINREEIKKEFIDLLHFVLAIAVVWELSADEIYEAYRIKHEINLRRHEEGY